MNNFNAANSEAGRQFEEAVMYYLRARGWTVTGGRSFDGGHLERFGVEIDVLAVDPDGVEHTIECKGSPRGAGDKRPGCERTDTVKKAVADAWILTVSGGGPHILATSHLPRGGVGQIMLETALKHGLFAAVINPFGGTS